MSRTKIVAVAAGAVLAAGGGTAVLVGPAFGAASSGSTSATSTSSTASTVAPTATAAANNSGSCKKPYPPSKADVLLTASPTSIKKGQSSTLTVTLTYNGCALSKEPVSINTGNTLVTSGTTDNKGVFSASVSPQKDTTYYAKFAGDGVYLANQSGNVTVAVSNK